MGSSGGGSSSGAVSYPAYMETQHEAWLTDIDTAIATAAANSPYASATAYNPDCVLNATNVILSQFNDVVIALDPTVDWSTYYDDIAAKYTDQTFTAITEFTFVDPVDSTITPDAVTEYSFTAPSDSAITLTAVDEFTFTDPFSDAEIAADIATHDAEVTARITNDTLPAYKVGMQNINAVMTSAFTIGSALITAQGLRDTNVHASTLRIANQKNKLSYEGMQADAKGAYNQAIIGRDGLVLNQALTNKKIELDSEAAQLSSRNIHNQNSLGKDTLLLNQSLANKKNTLEANVVQLNAKNTHNNNIIAKDKLALSEQLAVMQNSLSGSDMVLKSVFQEVSMYQAVATLTTDANRIKMIAKQEQAGLDYDYDDKDVRWGLDMYKHGATMMASVSGGVPAMDPSTPSKGASALGGAMSGAAAGSYFGPWGAVIGGVIGGIGGLL